MLKGCDKNALQYCVFSNSCITFTGNIVVDFQGKPEKMRLFCVNTPDSVHPDKKQNIPMGKIPSDFTTSRFAGRQVELEFEGSRIRGRYGRLLPYSIVEGQNFKLE